MYANQNHSVYPPNTPYKSHSENINNIMYLIFSYSLPFFKLSYINIVKARIKITSSCEHKHRLIVKCRLSFLLRTFLITIFVSFNKEHLYLLSAFILNSRAILSKIELNVFLIHLSSLKQNYMPTYSSLLLIQTCQHHYH